MKNPSTKPVPGQSGEVIGTLNQQTWPILIWKHVLKAAIDHSKQNTTCEQAGFLLGGCYYDQQNYLEIETFLPAQHVRADLSSLTFTHDTWATLNRQIEQHYPNLQVIGWQHSHPGFGVFLSEKDLFIQKHFFSCPWQVALVIDPQREELGFFQWEMQKGQSKEQNKNLNQQQLKDTGFILINE